MFTEKIKTISAATGIGPEAVRSFLEAAHPKITSLKELLDLPVGSVVLCGDEKPKTYTREYQAYVDAFGMDTATAALWRTGANPFRVVFNPAAWKWASTTTSPRSLCC